ncbi:RimK family protein [Lignipirellula cremea]|uniref:Glutathione synthetase n=1 Tax=Lignipirellula cremea TaxID=2528010 RepID=A0A518DS46_9BACT|nr:RimK family protein [Lignipirellula cremea]QDU94666.1 glutathione synthetase [Lignipirellula cremea]
MAIIIVVNELEEWPFDIPGLEVVDAHSYLTKEEYNDLRSTKVFNLCRSYRYQTAGYYVSLLAEARGHKPLPNVSTLQDLKSQAVVRMVSAELDDLIQQNLERIQSDKFTLSIYFGRNLAKRYDRLSLQLFNMFQSPLLRAQFSKDKDGRWQLRSVSTIAGNEIPQSHHDFVAEVAAQHFAGRAPRVRRKAAMRYDLAILRNPEEKEPPSNKKAIAKFIKAAESLAIRAELIGRDDYGRLAEFDALFIRETTYVNHHTYRFARRAVSEGLIVIDDPVSILRATNKVYLAELMQRHKILTPKTLVVHRENVDRLVPELGLPVVLKKPDSAFSQGVTKAENEEQLAEQLDRLFAESELIVAQEFLPTIFDWRIGVVDQRPLYACKYHMAPNHWQIIRQEAHDDNRYGRVETIPIELAPRKAVSVALKAANLIGDGLYGVDVKQSGDKFYVIEVNDNPTISAGEEDTVLRDELYRRIMRVFLARIEQKKQGTRST